jgi:hypothetical protein
MASKSSIFRAKKNAMNFIASLIMSKTDSLWLVMLPVFLLTAGCMSPRLTVEFDQVKDETRHKLEINYYSGTFNPQYHLKQTILKVVRKDHQANILVYDIITATGSKFNITPEVYLLADDQVYRVQISSIEYQTNRKIDENTKDILTADSTDIKVVTGYTMTEKQITRFEYALSPEITRAILNAKSLAFRYYAGPEMITMHARESQIAAVRQLLHL